MSKRGRPFLSNPEIICKVLDLLDIFSIGELAEKIGVEHKTVLDWSDYRPGGIEEHKRKILRKWYYYIRNHKGDKGAYRTIVFDRYGLPKKCSFCGKTSGRIHVHHMDGDHTNNDIRNLQPLCPAHHRKVHSEKGGSA